MLLLESLLPGHCIRWEDTIQDYYVWVDETLYRNQGELAEEIRLMPSDYFTGRVVDDEGKGVPGVTVGAHLRTALVGYLAQALQTDENGRFEIYRIPLDHSAYTLGYISFKRDGMVPTKIDDIFTLSNDRKRDLEIVMSRGYSVSGTLTDVDGNAAPDILVEVVRIRRDTPTGRSRDGTYRKAAKTDSMGSFVIIGISGGEYKIQAIDVPSLQKVAVQTAIDEVMSDLSLQLSRMICPLKRDPLMS